MLKQLMVISFILISTIFFISCSNCCEVSDYETFLPLDLGNKWYYGDKENREVVDKNVFNGKEYSDVRIELENFEGDLLTFNIYYHFDGSKLYQYTNEDKIEVLLADFSLGEGDSFEQSNTGYIVKVTSDDPMNFTFEYNQPEWADEEYEITFRHDVGILSECSFAWGGCTELTDYELK